MILLPVVEQSQVGAARRQAVRLGRDAGLDRAACDRLALIVTEIATNLVRHAVEGELLVGRTAPHEPPGCHVVGLDGGPGVPSVEKALEDGFTTATRDRGIGGGLGAIRRMSDAFDIHTDPGGTTVAATVAPGWQAAAGPLDVAGLIVPKPGTEAGGDGWGLRPGPDRSLVLLIDVLGHGETAAGIAETALAAFREAPADELAGVEQAVSAALAGDRGAAILLAEVPHGPGPLRAIGVGNVRGEVLHGRERRGIVSAAGIAGQMTRSKTAMEYDWGPGALLVLSTDGLRERVAAPEPAGLMFRSPLAIAATLYRRRRRGTDDSGVVVVRAGPAA